MPFGVGVKWVRRGCGCEKVHAESRATRKMHEKHKRESSIRHGRLRVARSPSSSLRMKVRASQKQAWPSVGDQRLRATLT